MRGARAFSGSEAVESRHAFATPRVHPSPAGADRRARETPPRSTPGPSPSVAPPRFSPPPPPTRRAASAADAAAAAAADPGLAAAHAGLADANAALGQLEAAISEMRKVLAQDVDGSYHYRIAKWYQQTGHAEEARAAFAETARRKAKIHAGLEGRLTLAPAP